MLTTSFTQQDRLWVADPRAINHILRNSRTAYKKPDSIREMSAIFVDRGVSSADGNVVWRSVYPHILTIIGEVHKRQRKALSPAFGLAEAKGLLPCFAQTATKVHSSLAPSPHFHQSTLRTAGR